MILDCRSEDYVPARDQCRVLVDGKEIRLAFYVDTDAGIVKTYDVAGDGEFYTASGIPTRLLEKALVEGWEMPEDQLASKTIRGAVQIRPFAPTN